MPALMMDDYQLTLGAIARRAEQLFPHASLLWRDDDGQRRVSSFAESVERSWRLAAALRDLGVERGDRIATLCWNHGPHLESLLGAALCGAVGHALNPRLHADDLEYIVGHAADRVLIADSSLVENAPMLEGFEHVVIVGEPDRPSVGFDYEELIAACAPRRELDVELRETDGASMCFTSGTTGRPKGVLYSHRAICLQALLGGARRFRYDDVFLSAVPLFHVHGWGYPFSALLSGCNVILAGRRLDAEAVVAWIAEEGVTVAAGVPPIWMDVLRAVEKRDDDPLASLEAVIIGGSSPSDSMIAGLEQQGVQLAHAWGMTETGPVATLTELTREQSAAPPDVRRAALAKQGRPVPFVEIRARSDEGLVPWDGTTMGELEVRGPWVAGAYFRSPESAECWTDDGWLRTGDVVSIEPGGVMHIRDRLKDLIKSGGEWISSVALEQALESHPGVREAAVIPVADQKWQERPAAAVVPEPGQASDPVALQEHLRGLLVRWWVPDQIVFVDELPRTSVGKIDKRALRLRVGGHG